MRSSSTFTLLTEPGNPFGKPNKASKTPFGLFSGRQREARGDFGVDSRIELPENPPFSNSPYTKSQELPTDKIPHSDSQYAGSSGGVLQVKEEAMEFRVLYVDDHKIVRETVRDWVGSRFPSFKPFEAEDGEEAVRIAADRHPHLIIMDVGLPGINGIEATRRIKATAPETRVIVLTVHDNPEFQADAKDAGADGYVVKDRAISDLIPLIIKLTSKNGSKVKGTLEHSQ